MTFPLVSSDADPDPTTQIAWPGARPKRSQPQLRAPPPEDTRDHDDEGGQGHAKRNSPDSSPENAPGKRQLTAWNLITLSIAMGGAQIAWTVELGYGTPFLLSLGISEQLTSLVWLAGPISGLVAQPIIGAISDSSHSKYRRRYWIVLSTVVLCLSTLVLAYCQNIAAFFVDLFGGGAGDWDPKRIKQVSNTSIGLAIFSFYLLDFALNALQASLRNLLLDITPPQQLNAGTAWHGRMTHAGNIIGFGFGFLPLANLPVLRLLGGDQFRKFCVVAMIILVITVWITCFCHEEKATQTMHKQKKGTAYQMFENIYNAIVNLPKPIRSVCFVQVFAFMGWFPFLFYSTTYVGQIMAQENNAEPDKDVATRKGEFAMLIYSIVAVAAGSILPQLARRDSRLLPKKEEDEDAEMSRLRNIVREWRAEASRKGKPLRLPMQPFLLRNIWTGALLLFTVLTFSTFFVATVVQATVVISLIGICWAVACWVPFAIIMELLKEMDEEASETTSNNSNLANSSRPRRPSSRNRAISSPSFPSDGPNEQQPLIRRRSFEDYEEVVEADGSTAPVTGGTILGIHNIAIVFPQFAIALIASAIFNAVDSDIDDDPANHHIYLGKNGVAWVLRFGGLCTLIGAVIARMVPPTRTEREMRRMLAEMKELRESDDASP